MYLKDKRRRQPSGKAVTLTMVITERLAQLRRSMAQHGMDGYVVVTDDFHGSEYVGDYFKARAYLSGFTGSAGTLVVLPDRAALWTDGRYFLQAADQLVGSGIELMRMGQPNVPTIVSGGAAAGGRRTGLRWPHRLQQLCPYDGKGAGCQARPPHR